MSTPLFYPPVIYMNRIDPVGAIGLDQVCLMAGVPCRATGAWIKRQIVIEHGPTFMIYAEPGGWGVVRLVIPEKTKGLQMYRHALAAMAYGLMDIVARESIRSAPWSKPAAAVGRKPNGHALSGAERQRRHRSRTKSA